MDRTSRPDVMSQLEYDFQLELARIEKRKQRKRREERDKRREEQKQLKLRCAQPRKFVKPFIKDPAMTLIDVDAELKAQKELEESQLKGAKLANKYRSGK